MSNYILPYWEHCGFKEPFLLKEEHSELLSEDNYSKVFTKNHKGTIANKFCFEIKKMDEHSNDYHLKTGYFIGVDWVKKDEIALYIAPKLNKDENEVNYINMLFSSLRHSEVSKEINELFEVKWEQPAIEIEQKQDLLTPFLVVEFLSLLKIIVRKGLKKSYYKVEQNLHSKVKGKILVGKTIKNNHLKNKYLRTFCSYDEFGLNNKENRLLNKALTFVKRYLPIYTKLFDSETENNIQNTFNFINPAFFEVSDEIELNEIKHSKTNAFYKEYEQAILLAKLILKRFGYNISNTVKDKIQTPPFWIDMSKLFELYVLGLLKDRFRNNVKFQHTHSGNELDFLLDDKEFQMVIDAKYKLKYINGKYDEDIRQVSGYARLKNVYSALNKQQGEVIDCLIIHPDQNGFEDLMEVDLKQNEINQYYDVYKVGVKLPLV